MKMPLQTAFLTAVLLVAAPSVMLGSDWEFSFAPYLWGSGLDGEVGAGPVTAPVEADFGDILENLDAGFLAHFEASKDEWTVLADLVYLDLGVTSGRFQTDVRQTIFEAGAAYRLSGNGEVLFGARLFDLSTEIDVGSVVGPLIRVESDQDWVDPFVGVRWSPEINEKWSFLGRVDVGGFGVGSELTWNAAATFLWQATERVTVGIGYRLMDIDYEDESPRFVYDVQLGGALVGVGFDF